MPTSFTPLPSLFGGVLIGAAAVALMAFHGRILGATGLVAGLLFGPDRALRAALIGGMATGPALFWLLSGEPAAITMEASAPGMIVSGLIVGFGATIGGGCTSGHGVCGMARLSRRSILATLIFMAACAATVFVTRHLLG